MGSEQPLGLLATPPGSRHFRAFFTAARTVELLRFGGFLRVFLATKVLDTLDTPRAAEEVWGMS